MRRRHGWRTFGDDPSPLKKQEGQTAFSGKPLTREEVCRRAGVILAAIDTRRGPHDGGAALADWTRLWALMEETMIAGFTFKPDDARPWSYVEGGDNTAVTRRRLVSGEFEIPVPRPNAPHLEMALPAFLNWACVPQPKRI